MGHDANKGHVPGDHEFETDPDSFSNHYYQVCEICHATLWTCPKAYEEWNEPHPKPGPCKPASRLR
jgi:hypothetical protein